MVIIQSLQFCILICFNDLHLILFCWSAHAHQLKRCESFIYIFFFILSGKISETVSVINLHSVCILDANASAFGKFEHEKRDICGNKAAAAATVLLIVAHDCRIVRAIVRRCIFIKKSERRKKSGAAKSVFTSASEKYFF